MAKLEQLLEAIKDTPYVLKDYKPKEASLGYRLPYRGQVRFSDGSFVNLTEAEMEILLSKGLKAEAVV